MPTFRVNVSGNEGESIEDSKLGAASALAPEVARVSNNMVLADHIGQFIAGNIASQFQDENLADMLKGRIMIMISGSWG